MSDASSSGLADPIEPTTPVAAEPVTGGTGEAQVAEAVDPNTVDHIVGISFDKITRADEALLTVVHLQREGEVAIADAVVVAKGDDERIHIRQTIDPTPGRSALSGSFWGLLVGTIVGGPIVGMIAGAGGGALLAKLIDLGLDDKWIKDVATWLDPGTSALLLLVSGPVRPALVRELERFDGTVLYCTFPDAVRQELERALSTHARTSGTGPTDLSGPAATDAP